MIFSLLFLSGKSQFALQWQKPLCMRLHFTLRGLVQTFYLKLENDVQLHVFHVKKVSILHVVFDFVLHFTNTNAILMQYWLNTSSSPVLLLTLEVLECQMHLRLY